MARPRKWRKVCCLPVNDTFGPIDAKETDEDIINMTVEEYETIRLIDHENFTQEECSGYMNVARTTVQQIYANARKKIAGAIVDGKILRINGGVYELCCGKEETCGCGGCRKHRRKNYEAE